jgi:hypothetical protein
MQAEFERLNALPLIELAVEVMTKGFGPGGPGAVGDAAPGHVTSRAATSVAVISFEFAPERGFTSPIATAEDRELRDQIAQLIAEGMQELEHASLVIGQLNPPYNQLAWAATRRGRAALQRGEVLGILQRQP